MMIILNQEILSTQRGIYIWVMLGEEVGVDIIIHNKQVV